MPGVTIGNHVVLGAGAIVTKGVESNCIVLGKSARVIKRGIKFNNKGQLVK
jgi:acetyltransferase-like isoleucine patch superfamily enzyme